MAEPYDFMLSKYIQIGKAAEKHPNHTLHDSAHLAKQLAMENFGDTHTKEEYDDAEMECQQHVQETYANRFTRIDE